MWILAGLIAITAAILIVRGMKRLSKKGRAKAVTRGLLALNGTLILASVLVFFFGVPGQANAQSSTQGQPAVQSRTAGTSNVPTAAALATGLACIGAGIGVGLTGAAAIGSMAQKPEIFGRSLVFVGLAEGIAIYGLVVSFMLLTGAFG
ncbi:ATP synthase subunit C [Salinispira pacifica]